MNWLLKRNGIGAAAGRRRDSGRCRRLWKRRFPALCLVLSLALSFLAACSASESGDGKIRDLEFTVAGEMEVPEELKRLIGEKQTQPFKLTYSDEKNLYIAVGYGAQPTGGYSICVRELYLTDNSIVISTELKGPEKGENAGSQQSFPYIVIRTEYLEEPVVFR